jgi:hypothetical protein
MSLWASAWQFVRGRLLASALTTVSVASGVSLILATLLLTQREAICCGDGEIPGRVLDNPPLNQPERRVEVRPAPVFRRFS